jgi:tape measure domain-containing protein
MTQSAGIQLQVGLDLAFFRQQLTTLGATAAGYPLKFKVEFDRLSVQNELNALAANIKKRNYFLEVKTNLGTEIENAKKLADALVRLQQVAQGTKGALPIGPGALGLKKGAGQPGANEIKALYEALAIAGAEGFETGTKKTRAQMVTQIGAVAKDTIAGLLNGLKSQDARVQAAAKSLGAALITSMKAVLGIASPSTIFKDLGKNVGKSFEMGSVSSMNDAFDALEALTGRRLRRLKAQFAEGARGALAISGGQVSRVSVSDVTPRNFERIAGSSTRGALPPGVDRSAETLQNFYRSLDQIGIALASTVDSTERAADAFKTLRNAIDSLIIRAKVLASEQSLQARLRPSSVPSGMPLLTGRAPGRALPMLSAAAQRPERFTSQEKLFKDFLGRTIKAVISESGSAAIGRSLFGGTQFREIGNAMRRPQLGAGIDTKVETVAVKDLTSASRNIAAATNALKAQKLLPAAGGTSASQMIRQVLSGLPPLKAPQIGAQNISPRGSLGQFPMEGMMAPSSPLGSMGRFPMDPMLAAGGASAVGQKIAGPYPFSNTARSARGGYFPGIRSSAFFPMSGMMGPSSPLGPITPQSSMFGAGGPPGGPPRPPSGGGGGMGGMSNFGSALGSVNLPGAGVVREIGSEFAMAAKQVLLFGTAYKALAFLTSFPSQVQQAVSSLQSFRNTLKEITPSAQEFDSSNKFVLSLVDQYNIPLQSAREGFTKLYASMAPAGFSGQEIRGLFEGISVGAATFGMSADKVDRVMYAFAQMASKGQVMSEELKGQLGDVLPGALSLFARAADMSLTDFGKAMEDGAFKGDAMRQLLINVGATMKEEFGKGAVGAALTFQGVMNRLQTTVTVFYETFEPAAVAFSNAFVLPLTNGIRIVTDAFKQLTTGQAATTQLGAELASRMQPLIPIFEGIGNNIKMAVTAVVNFAKALMPVVQLLLQLASTPIVGVLAQAYTTVLLLNGAFTLLGGRILVGLIASIGQTIGQLMLMNQTAIMTSSSLTGTQLQLRLLSSGLTATGGAATAFAATMKTAMMTTVVGAIAVAVAFGISEFMRLRGVMDSVAGRYKSIGDQARMMGESGNVSGVQRLNKNLLDQANTYEKIAKGLNRAQRAGGMLKIDKETQDLLKRAGLEGYDAGTGILTNADANNIKAAINANRQETRNTKKVLSDQEKKAKTEAAKLDATLKKQALPPGGGDDAAAKKAAAEAARLASQQQQNAIDAANLQNALDKARYDGLTTLGDQAFQHATSLIDARNNYELAGLDSIASRQEKFQQDLQKIELDRIDTVRQATQKAVEASLKFTAAQNTAVAAVAGRTQGGGTGLFQGSTGISSGPHFDVRRADGGIISEAEARAVFSEDVRRQLTMTSGYGPRRAPARGASTFHRGIDLAGPANTPLSLASGYSLMGVGQEGGLGYAASVQGPQGQSYKVGHLQKPSAGYTMQRREAKAGGNLQVEQLERSNALEAASFVAINATTEALAKREALIASNINTIFPVAEQRLQNDLTKIRNDLQLKGMPQEYIDYQEESYKASYEMSEAIKKNKEDTDKYQQTVDALQGKKAKGIALTADETNALTFYTGAIAQNKASLETLAKQQAEYNIAALEGALAAMKNADALKAQQETMGLIKSSVESASNSYKGFLKEVVRGGDPSEALKKFQDALTDQVLTVFFDFAMKPVEDFFKEQLNAMFGVETEESAREKAIAKMEEQLNELKASKEIQSRIDQNVQAIASGGGAGQSLSEATINQGFGSIGGVSFGGMQLPGLDKVLENIDFETAFEPLQKDFGATLENLSSTLDTNAYSLSQSAIDYSANFKDVGDSAKKMAEDAGKAAEEAGKNGKDFQESLGKVASGIGIAAGAIMGIAAGISQIKKGGTGNTLMGIGSILASAGGAIGGFTKLFGANGGVAGGGWKPFPVSAFANGGMVKGPTLGLVGEGKYNEAIVPLPDGRSIPVQMRGAGGSGSRDLLANQAQSRPSPSVLSMSFQSTTINGVEYVDRAQLEAAMEETRRAASREGANKGANLAIDRLANSPSSRRRAGIR